MGRPTVDPYRRADVAPADSYQRLAKVWVHVGGVWREGVVHGVGNLALLVSHQDGRGGWSTDTVTAERVMPLYAYRVEIAPPEYTVDAPESLWRRAGDSWEYLSLIDWSWHTLDETRLPVAPPPEEALVQVDEARAHQLASDRQLWVRYWAIHGRDDPYRSGEPINVARRRSSPEDLREEVYARNQWVRTSVLVRAESGMSSDTPPLRPIEISEAEAILRRVHGVTGATEL